MFAVIFAENTDIVATYPSEAEALQALADFIAMNAQLTADIGLREYRDGRPIGEWQSAAQLSF